MGDGDVTRNLVRFRKALRTSSVRWLRDSRCSRWLTTRKPRFCIICCCTVGELSISSHRNATSLPHTE